MNEEIINKIINLLYQGRRAAGVSRVGMYNVPREIFKSAAIHYLKTGENKLPEYDELVYLSWTDNKSSNDWDMWNRRQLKIFYDALAGVGFWDINGLYNQEVIEDLKERAAQSERYLNKTEK